MSLPGVIICDFEMFVYVRDDLGDQISEVQYLLCMSNWLMQLFVKFNRFLLDFSFIHE